VEVRIFIRCVGRCFQSELPKMVGIAALRVTLLGARRVVGTTCLPCLVAGVDLDKPLARDRLREPIGRLGDLTMTEVNRLRALFPGLG